MKKFWTKLVSTGLALLMAGGLSYAAIFTSSLDRIIASGTSAPAISACGTGTLATGSSDTAGTFTATGATGCTLTFGTAWALAPSCTVNELTINTAARTTAITTTTLVVAAGGSGSTYTYICVGKAGG